MALLVSNMRDTLISMAEMDTDELGTFNNWGIYSQ